MRRIYCAVCLDSSSPYQSIASRLMGAYHVVGVDVDQEALDTAWVNLKKNEIDCVDLIQSDVQSISFSWGKCIDCVHLSYVMIA